MMSTARASRPSKDKTAKSSHAQNAKSDGQPLNMKNQATAEQMRIAQITDKPDDAIEIQIKQVTELTGRDKDEALLALHDCDYDLNRAVERLLENEADLGEWQDAPTKKKRNQTSNKQHGSDGGVSNHKSTEKRDRSLDRDTDRDRDKENAPRGRRDRGPPRFNRGRGRENQDEGQNDSRSRDRGFGERGRGRGRGGSRGRGGGRGNSSGSRGGFKEGFSKERNQADQGPQIDTWTNETANKTEKENSIGAWGDMMENDWQVEADEWTGPLDNTKIFTASSTSDSKVFSSMNDNDATMFTPPPSIETQVFTASSLSNTANSVSPLNDSSAPSYQQNPIGQGPLTQNSFGQRLDLDMLLQPKSSDANSVSTQQSSFMTQFAKQAEESIKNAVGITSSPSMSSQHMAGNSQSMGGPPGMASQQLGGPPGMTNPSMGMGSQPAVTSTARSAYVGGPAQAQAVSQRSKPQRTKLPPPSKIPASAVEMPGSMNFNVDVQFGNWADSGFSFGNSQPDSSNTASSLSSVVVSTSPGVISNHLPSQVTQSTTPADADPAIMSASSGAPTTSEAALENLTNMGQPNSQSPRPNVFQNSNSATPPKDYNKTSLSQQTKISSPLEPIPYPASQPDRKSAAYGSQRPNSGSMSSNNPVSSSQMSFSQPGYSGSSYPSSAYKSGPPMTTANYSSGHSNSGLQSAQYGTGSSYQNSSFQGQSGFSSENQSSSLYQNASNQAGSFQSGGSGGSGGSGYQSQPSGGSYQSQSTYHRETQSAGSSYQPSNNQSGPYQSGGPQTSSAYQTSASQSSGSGYQRDSQSGQSNFSQSFGSSGHQNNLQTSPLSTSKLTDTLSKMSVKDTALDSASNQYDHSSNSVAALSLTSTTTTTSSSLASGSMSVPSALGLSSVSGAGSAASTSSSSMPSKPVTSKAPPNLPPGVPPIIGHNYMVGQPGFPLAAFGLTQPPLYTYEDLQLQLQQQQRLLPGYYDMQFQPPTTLTGRDQSTAAALAGTVPGYTGATDASKLGRMEAQSPVTAQSSQPPQQTAQSAAAAHQQTFINAATLPPAYANYYYPAGSVLPGGYSYQPTMFPLPSVTNAAHAGTTGTAQFQKPGAYGSHAYGAGYADTTAAAAAQDFNKSYGGVSQAQVKGSTAGTGVVTTASDLTGAAYGKTHSQSYDKAGFHGGTPPPFNLLPTGTQAGPMGATPTAYGTPYVPVMAHQPHSQMLHHHMQQDSNSGSSRGTGPSASQTKAAGTKNYSTAYWGSN